MKIENLTKYFGDTPVLEHLTLEFRDGRITAVMGSSGCGKTTMFHIMMGILKADEGSVEDFIGKKISAVFQENRLMEFLTAAENIMAVQRIPDEKKALNQILIQILPEDALGKKVSEYSGGMKRRAAIARAMLAESDLIIMDEPFTGLDEKTRELVMEFIQKYRKGRTMIFSTHQEAEAELLHADRIVLTAVGDRSEKSESILASPKA